MLNDHKESSVAPGTNDDGVAYALPNFLQWERVRRT